MILYIKNNKKEEKTFLAIKKKSDQKGKKKQKDREKLEKRRKTIYQMVYPLPRDREENVIENVILLLLVAICRHVKWDPSSRA